MCLINCNVNNQFVDVYVGHNQITGIAIESVQDNRHWYNIINNGK